MSEGARCQAEAGEVVSLEQRPAVPGTELGVGFQVVTQGEKGEHASPWCNQMACKAGMDGEETCGTAASWHCFTWSGTCWCERCYIIRY